MNSYFILILPRTASEVLATRLGDSITLVADPDLKRMKKPESRGWNILFLQTPVSERIRALQKIDLNILEVAEIFESRQIIDTDTGLRHPVRITINNAEEVEFPNKDYEFDRIMVFLIAQEILPV